MEGWQLGISGASFVALVVIGLATVWTARQSGKAAGRAVELAEAGAMLERLKPVSQALEETRDLLKKPRTATGQIPPNQLESRVRALRELQQSLLRVEMFRENLPRSVAIVARAPETWTGEEIDAAIIELLWLTRKVADPKHPSQGII